MPLCCWCLRWREFCQKCIQWRGCSGQCVCHVCAMHVCVCVCTGYLLTLIAHEFPSIFSLAFSCFVSPLFACKSRVGQGKARMREGKGKAEGHPERNPHQTDQNAWNAYENCKALFHCHATTPFPPWPLHRQHTRLGQRRAH